MQCTKSKCESPAEEGKKMCRVHLAEASAKAMEYYRASHGASKKRRGGGTTNVLVPVKQKTLVVKPVKTADLDGNVLMVIDGAILKLHDDVQMLERAKEILTRG